MSKLGLGTAVSAVFAIAITVTLPRKILLLTCSAITFIVFFSSGRVALANDIQIIFQQAEVTLTYSRLLETSVDVQVSTDPFWLSWQSAQAFDEILKEDGKTETIRSHVSVSGATQLFFRLAISPGWTVRLTWDAVPDPSVAGYRLYYRGEDQGTGEGDGVERRLDVGNNTTAQVSLPIDLRTYHFAVTSYNTQGAESDRSGEVLSTRRVGNSY